MNDNFYEIHKDLELPKKVQKVRIGDWIKVIDKHDRIEHYQVIEAINVYKRYENKTTYVFKLKGLKNSSSDYVDMTLTGRLAFYDVKLSFEFCNENDMIEIEKLKINIEKRNIQEYISNNRYSLNKLSLEDLKEFKSKLEKIVETKGN